MEANNLSVESRDLKGKGPARRLRMIGKIPAVLYGRGDHKLLATDPRVLERTLVQEGGKNQVFRLKGAGVDDKAVLVKDYQIDPVTRRLLHVDLFEIDITAKVEVTVAINFTGKSQGVVEGGILNVIEREILVSCLPDRIPKHIDIDVTPLKIGDSLHLDEVQLPEGLEKISKQNPTICAVVPPAKEEELVASLTPAAEPEVIKEKKPEAGEGEAAAATDAKGGAKDKEKDKDK